MKAFDSYAWIEYFKGSPSGTKARMYVEGRISIYTPAVCLTEIKARYLRDGKDPSERVGFILERSFVIDIDEEIALRAADYKQKHGLHTIDALIYASAQSKRLELVTGDLHFKGLDGVEMI